MNAQVIELLQKRWVIPSFVGVVAFSGGVGVGYILGKRSSTNDEVEVNHQMTIFEVPEPEEFAPVFEHIEVVEEIIIEEEPEEELEEELDEEDEYEESQIPEVGEVVTNHNVFAAPTSNWDYEWEVSNRDSGAPYVIHVDEYMADEMGYSQETLTYYQGDDVMTDQEDAPIYNYNSLLGELKFGHGSGDPTVVYCRNDAIRMEWEVLLHTGKYQEEILGYTIENDFEMNDLKHSTIHKFRMD